MKSRQRFAVLSLLVLSTLGGCIGYEEELWVNPDGSGRVHSKIILSEMLAQKIKKGDESSDFAESLADRFKEIEGLEVAEAKTYEKAGDFIVSLKMNFDSWERLMDVQRRHQGSSADFFSESSADFWGTVSLTNEEGRLVFSRTVQMGTGEQENEENGLGAGLMEAMFSGYSWKYTVHFPVNVVSANTADEEIDRERSTVTWEVSLMSVIKKPYTMTATLEQPRRDKYRAYTIVGLVAVALIGLAVWWSGANK